MGCMVDSGCDAVERGVEVDGMNWAEIGRGNRCAEHAGGYRVFFHWWEGGSGVEVCSDRFASLCRGSGWRCCCVVRCRNLRLFVDA